MFFLIPGFIILLAWSQAIYLLVDKNLNPIEAIKASNDITYGEKLTIFLGHLSIGFLFLIIYIILSGILLSLESYSLLAFFIIPFNLFYVACMMSCSAYIYGELSKKLD